MCEGGRIGRPLVLAKAREVQGRDVNDVVNHIDCTARVFTVRRGVVRLHGHHPIHPRWRDRHFE